MFLRLLSSLLDIKKEEIQLNVGYAAKKTFKLCMKRIKIVLRKRYWCDVMVEAWMRKMRIAKVRDVRLMDLLLNQNAKRKEKEENVKETVKER